MGFMEAVKTVLGKYADFNGRARRSEYWYWTLAVTLAAFALIALAIIFAVADVIALAIVFYVLVFIMYLAVLVPSIAVAVRRLHDTGKPGVYFLFAFIPFVGGIILLVFMVGDSTPDNQWGPNPKGASGGYGGYGQQQYGYGQQQPQYGQPGQQQPGYGQQPPPPSYGG